MLIVPQHTEAVCVCADEQVAHGLPPQLAYSQVAGDSHVGPYTNTPHHETWAGPLEPKVDPTGVPSVPSMQDAVHAGPQAGRVPRSD
jgi:hypothetical protein